MSSFIANWIGVTLSIWLYFLPMVFCHVFYFVRTARNWRKDRAVRARAEEYKARGYATLRELPEGWKWSDAQYSPTDTIGTILGRVLVSWIPVANLWAALFDLGPQVFGRFFDWIEKIFDQPLVPKKRQEEEE